MHFLQLYIKQLLLSQPVPFQHEVVLRRLTELLFAVSAYFAFSVKATRLLKGLLHVHAGHVASPLASPLQVSLLLG